MKVDARSVREGIEKAGIRLKSYTPGEHTTICPRCNATRKAHKNARCLSVRIDADGSTWNCHHCGWADGFKLRDERQERPQRQPAHREVVRGARDQRRHPSGWGRIFGGSGRS